jgi:4-amino-4-deoxy-L-arabinose transferase-like glycosyltransferase
MKPVISWERRWGKYTHALSRYRTMLNLFTPYRSLLLKIFRITLAMFLATVYLHGIGEVKFHSDESLWISHSNFFEAYFSGQFHNPIWAESYWTLTQPPVPYYLIGLGRRLDGYGPTDLNRAWSYGMNEQENIAAGAMPSEDLLWWSRLPSACLAIASILIISYVLRKAAGELAASVWIVLCAANPYLLTQLRRAMGESALLFGVALVLLACYLMARSLQDNRPTRLWKGLAWAGILGLFTGLASASKLNGLSVAVGGALLAAITSNKETFKKRLIFIPGSILLMFLCAAVIFTGLDPYLWPDPMHGAQHMLDQRLNEMSLQIQRNPSMHIDSLASWLQLVPGHIFQAFQTIRFSGSLWLNLLICVVGLSWLAGRALSSFRLRSPDSAPLAILMIGLAACLPPLFTPLNWDRYYLLPVIFAAVSISTGISRFCLAIVDLLSHRKTRPNLLRQNAIS